MFPHSDVDLLLLYRRKDRETAEDAIKRLLHDLWDLRLDLGHQVWSLEELTAQGPELELALSLSDARSVTGNPALGNLLPQRISSPVVSNPEQGTPPWDRPPDPRAP